MSKEVQIHKVFDDVHAHQHIAVLIQRFSTNKRDIHRTAMDGLDLKGCRNILDLGCAFGSFTEKLNGRMAPDADVTGVDTVAAYESLFLGACERAGLRGRFLPTGISILNTFADQSYDLILCSYALYFFPEVIPEIARLLRNEGLFVAITHHQRNMGELIKLTKQILNVVGLSHDKHLPLEIITNRFSSENGEASLKPWFGGIKVIDFPNELVFPMEDIEHLTQYFRFKSPLFFSDIGLNLEAVMSTVLNHPTWVASTQKGIRISKDDRIFICTLPRHGKGNA